MAELVHINEDEFIDFYDKYFGVLNQRKNTLDIEKKIPIKFSWFIIWMAYQFNLKKVKSTKYNFKITKKLNAEGLVNYLIEYHNGHLKYKAELNIIFTEDLNKNSKKINELIIKSHAFSNTPLKINQKILSHKLKLFNINNCFTNEIYIPLIELNLNSSLNRTVEYTDIYGIQKPNIIYKLTKEIIQKNNIIDKVILNYTQLSKIKKIPQHINYKDFNIIIKLEKELIDCNLNYNLILNYSTNNVSLPIELHYSIIIIPNTYFANTIGYYLDILYGLCYTIPNEKELNNWLLKTLKIENKNKTLDEIYNNTKIYILNNSMLWVSPTIRCGN